MLIASVIGSRCIAFSGQHPNWGADIAAVNSYELSAFRQALESMLALYSLD
jgi:hypothetical protein